MIKAILIGILFFLIVISSSIVFVVSLSIVFPFIMGVLTNWLPFFIVILISCMVLVGIWRR